MNKTKNISARVTEKEYKEIAECAKNNSLKMSDYIVQSCLSSNSKSNQSISSYTATLIDTKKLLDKLIDGTIKKKEYIHKMAGVLKKNGIH